jgi:hypothetical protein
MNLEIKINLDNAAYDNVEWELAENLEQVVSRIGQGVTDSIVRDSNGNKVGTFKIVKHEMECGK